MQILTLPANLARDAGLETRLAVLQPVEEDADILIDFQSVSFVRPSGLAHVFVAIFTLLRNGYRVQVAQPENLGVRSYMRRAHFWSALEQCGAQVPPDWLGYNQGGAASLIECRMIPATSDLGELMQLHDALRGRFELALQNAQVDAFASATVWTELCGNAAEHSQSQHGAFVIAQCYAGREIEVAIADVGRGVHASLRHLGVEDEFAALMAATEFGVTGRVDAAGNPRDGGVGLWTVRNDADNLMIRSGNALVSNLTGLRDSEGLLVLTPTPCYPLAGTIVTASIFAVG